MADRRGPRGRRLAGLAAVGVALVLLAGCDAILESPPQPTPMDFPALAGELGQRGLVLDRITSGDDGCDDPTLAPTAIGFDASGLGVERDAPVRLRIFIFRNGEAFDRRRPDVDTCVAAWATDPATFELIDARPFVLAGQGPWPAGFESAVRDSLLVGAAGG